MKRCLLNIIVSLGLISLASSAFAQLPTTQKSPSDDRVWESVAKAEADQGRKDRQAQARLLLISLASDARSFRDQALRARSLTRIADALWDVDSEQGRTLFRNAWESAESADRESKDPTSLRRQVLAVVARRDRALAEYFLQKIKAAQEAAKTEPSTPSVWVLSEAAEQRLDLAVSLLRLGDTERALEFADPVLISVTISTIDFLTRLREKDVAAADQRYANLLAISGSSTLADANSVSLLSSYIFTPRTYVAFNIVGGADTSWMETPLPPVNVSPQVKLLFFQTAAAILLRPNPPPDQEHSSSGIVGKYMVVRRLLPIFDLYAPKEIAIEIHSQFEALSSLVSGELRKAEPESLQKGITPEKSLTEQEQPLRDQIDHAKTSSERDDLYFKLALLALNKGDLKAEDYISEIEDSSFRKRAKAHIDWGFTTRAVEKKETQKAVGLARKGELTHIQRVWAFTQLAKLLARSDPDEALSFVDEATGEARRIDGSDLDRPRALLGIANALNAIDPARMWDSIFDAVKAANSTDGFVGEGAILILVTPTKSQVLTIREPTPDFDIRGIFGEAGSADFERAVELARGFQGEAPRANATIAICRSVLNAKSAPVPKPSSAPAVKN